MPLMTMAYEPQYAENNASHSDRTLGIAGEDLALGMAVTVDPTTGLVMYANASTGPDFQVPCRGFTACAVDEGNPVTLMFDGILGNMAASLGIDVVPNGDFYLDTTDGQVTQTAPTGLGDVVQVVGWGPNKDTMVIRIENTVDELVGNAPGSGTG